MNNVGDEYFSYLDCQFNSDAKLARVVMNCTKEVSPAYDTYVLCILPPANLTDYSSYIYYDRKSGDTMYFYFTITKSGTFKRGGYSLYPTKNTIEIIYPYYYQNN